MCKHVVEIHIKSKTTPSPKEIRKQGGHAVGTVSLILSSSIYA